MRVSHSAAAAEDTERTAVAEWDSLSLSAHSAPVKNTAVAPPAFSSINPYVIYHIKHKGSEYLS